jgi:two-component system, response regulator RegA
MSEAALRVLLVDDSEAIRLTMGAVFEMMGHVVEVAESLAQARELQTAGVYDVAVLDVHIDDELGTDLIPDLRRIQPRALIVVLSGSASAETIVGADLVLDKGQDAELIVRTLEEAAAARATP